MKFDLVKPSRILITILTYIGLWRLNNKWHSLYRVHTFCLHFFLTFLTAASMWASVLTAKQIEQFSESLYMTLAETGIVGKLFNLVIFNNEVVEFFQLVQNEEFYLRTTEEINIFESSHRIFSIVTVLFLGLGLMLIILGFPLVVLGSNHRLLYPAMMPFSLNGQGFWFAYIFQLLGVTLTCVMNISMDLLHCYTFYHVSLIYRVLACRLRKIGSDISSPNMDEVIFEQLKEIVKIHQFVTRITKICERFTSFPNLTQIFLSALIICFTGYQIQSISPMENPGIFVENIILLMALCLQIYLPCYFANEVTLQSEQLVFALYSSNWMDFSYKSKRIIYIYMEYLKHPVYLKAGNLITIGLPTFSKTLNNAYSYFAVLINMKN